MATSSVTRQHKLIIKLSKLYPDYTIDIYQPVNEIYPYLYVTNGKYIVNIQIRLEMHLWELYSFTLLVDKAIKEIKKQMEKM